jgi:nucleoside-diphosphate-sugar epimerase
MRIFVAGASGAIGTRLVPLLTDRGHEVIGTSRSLGTTERVPGAPWLRRRARPPR